MSAQPRASASAPDGSSSINLEKSETSFLAHPSSLDYRTLYWQPKVFTGRATGELSNLLSADSDDLFADAREIAREKIAANDFALADDVYREVERIYQRGIAAVQA